ncbi:unnamed protein product [Merluccius merluccius]
MKMSLVQRVFLAWFFSLVFLIMLVLKLDSKINWSWFVIFLPVWTFDTILILMLVAKMAGRCKQALNPRDGQQNLRRTMWYLMALLLKLGFCLALCARLEKYTGIWLSVVCIPLWTLLVGALVELGYSVVYYRRD